MTAYLADILRRISAIIPSKPSDSESILINLDVPVASLHPASALPATYFRMLRTARLLSTRLHPSHEVAAISEVWLALRSSLSQPGPPGERREELIAEAVAAIGGLGEAAPKRRTDRNFAVVDVGAGTTDIGIFRYPQADARRVVFYSALTTAVGCDDLDREICRLFERSDPSAGELGIVRLAKTRIEADGDPIFDGVHLTAELVEEAMRPIEYQAMKAWTHAFGQAYSKEKREDRWRSLELFMIGGGSLVPGFRRIFAAPPWDRVRRVTTHQIGRDLKLRSEGAGTNPPAAEDMIFLLTALGLSLPPPEHPEMQHPETVPPYEPPPGGPTGDYDFDWHDMYSG